MKHLTLITPSSAIRLISHHGKVLDSVFTGKLVRLAERVWNGMGSWMEDGVTDYWRRHRLDATHFNNYEVLEAASEPLKAT